MPLMYRCTRAWSDDGWPMARWVVADQASRAYSAWPPAPLHCQPSLESLRRVTESNESVESAPNRGKSSLETPHLSLNSSRNECFFVSPSPRKAPPWTWMPALTWNSLLPSPPGSISSTDVARSHASPRKVEFE